MYSAGYFYSLRASKGSDVAAGHGLTVPFFSLLDSTRRARR
jgi:hypothetical protein